MTTDTIRLLFVCSGNTCRSPMASAIAAHFARGRSVAMPKIEPSSAGVSASVGASMTPSAVRSLESLRIEAPAEHLSRPLTRDLIESADAVYCMTPAHAAAAASLAPDAANRIVTLDPAGNPIPDPMGGSQRLYDDVCRLLAGLVAARIQEWDR